MGNCKDCRFLFEAKSSEDSNLIGYCRRYPPQVTYDEERCEYDSTFPEVFIKTECGEFKEKDMQVEDVAY